MKNKRRRKRLPWIPKEELSEAEKSISCETPDTQEAEATPEAEATSTRRSENPKYNSHTHGWSPPREVRAPEAYPSRYQPHPYERQDQANRGQHKRAAPHHSVEKRPWDSSQANHGWDNQASQHSSENRQWDSSREILQQPQQRRRFRHPEQEQVKPRNKDMWEGSNQRPRDAGGSAQRQQEQNINHRERDRVRPSANVCQPGLEHMSGTAKDWKSSKVRSRSAFGGGNSGRHASHLAEPVQDLPVGSRAQRHPNKPGANHLGRWMNEQRRHPSPRYARSCTSKEHGRAYFGRNESGRGPLGYEDDYRMPAAPSMPSSRSRPYDIRSGMISKAGGRAPYPEYEQVRQPRRFPRSIVYRDDSHTSRESRTYDDCLSVVSEPPARFSERAQDRRRPIIKSPPHSTDMYNETRGWTKPHHPPYKYVTNENNYLRKFEPSSGRRKRKVSQEDYMSPKLNVVNEFSSKKVVYDYRKDKQKVESQVKQLPRSAGTSNALSPKHIASLVNTIDVGSKSCGGHPPVMAPVDVEPASCKRQIKENDVEDEKRVANLSSFDKVVSITPGDHNPAGAVRRPVDAKAQGKETKPTSPTDNTYCLFKGGPYPLKLYNTPDQEIDQTHLPGKCTSKRLDSNPKTISVNQQEEANDKWFPMNGTNEQNCSSGSQRTHQTPRKSKSPPLSNSGSPSIENGATNSDESSESSDPENENDQPPADQTSYTDFLGISPTEDLWKSKSLKDRQGSKSQDQETKGNEKKSEVTERTNDRKKPEQLNVCTKPNSTGCTAIGTSESKVEPTTQNSSFYRPPPSVETRKQTSRNTWHSKEAARKEQLVGEQDSLETGLRSTVKKSVKHKPSDGNSEQNSQHDNSTFKKPGAHFRPQPVKTMNVSQTDNNSDWEATRDEKLIKSYPKDELRKSPKNSYPKSNVFSMAAIKKSLIEERAKKQEMKKNGSSQKTKKLVTPKNRGSDTWRNKINRADGQESSSPNSNMVSSRAKITEADKWSNKRDGWGEEAPTQNYQSIWNHQESSQRRGEQLRSGGRGLTQVSGGSSTARTAWEVTKISGLEDEKVDLQLLFTNLNTNFEHFRLIMEDHVRELNLKILTNGAEIKKIVSICETISEVLPKKEDTQLSIQRVCTMSNIPSDPNTHGFEHR